MNRYYITSEYISAFLGQTREIVNWNNTNVGHVVQQQTRMQKDEEAVIALASPIQSWVNPFGISNSLMSMSIARAAPQNIATDLKRKWKVGDN